MKLYMYLRYIYKSSLLYTTMLEGIKGVSLEKSKITPLKVLSWGQKTKELKRPF